MRVPVSQGRTETGTGNNTAGPARAPAPPAYPSGGTAPGAAFREKNPAAEDRRGRCPPFKRFIAMDHIRLIYWLGAIAIILVSLLEIGAGLSTPGTDVANMSFTNTTALAENPSASPLFWIGFLIVGSLVWRVFCELVAAVFRIYDALEEGEDAPADGDARYGEAWAEEWFVNAPAAARLSPPTSCGNASIAACRDAATVSV